MTKECVYCILKREKDGDLLDNLSDNKYGFIGQSLSYSYSPYINSLIGDYGFKQYEIAPNDVPTFLKTCDYKAMGIASPYKKIAYDLSVALSGSAIKSHFVNLVIKDTDGTLKGYNTDYDAFKALIKKYSINFSGLKVLILGTGGAAHAAKAVLSEIDTSSVIFVSRHGQNNYDNISVHYDSNILINATPVGMYPDNGASPVDLEGFTNLQLVIDFVYNPVRTTLIQQAIDKKIHVISGSYILAASSVFSAEIFLEKKFAPEYIDTLRKKILTNKRNIVLIGLPGSGKANIGHALAQTLQRPFIDLDAEIEKTENMSVSDIFQTKGEAYFRDVEKKITLRFCKENGNIISTGGGVIISKENRYALRENSFVVYIERGYNDLYNDGRPVSSSIENLQRLSEIRSPIYETIADTIIRAHSSVDANVNLILEALKNENPHY